MEIPTDGYTEEALEILELLNMKPRMSFRPNPLKRANLEYCEALARELSEAFDLELRIKNVPGGRRFDFRFFGASFPYDFTRLLGQLMARSSEFCPMADPGDPCYLIFSMTVFDQDRLHSNGKLVSDFPGTAEDGRGS